MIERQGKAGLEKVVAALRLRLKDKGYKLNTTVESSLEDKIKEIITIAFGKEENLVAGFAVENQGIEKARQNINTIKSKLDDYCAGDDIRSLVEIKFKLIQLIDACLNKSSHGNVTMYSAWILKILKASIENAKDEVEVIRILNNFEFSCTLDILHKKVSKEQNIWGLTMAGKLHKAILEHDEQAIYKILL